MTTLWCELQKNFVDTDVCFLCIADKHVNDEYELIEIGEGREVINCEYLCAQIEPAWDPVR